MTGPDRARKDYTVSKFKCSRRSLLRKGGIAGIGTLLAKASNTATAKVVDYKALIERFVRGGIDWKSYFIGVQPRTWVTNYLVRTPYATLDDALKAFLQAILNKGWTFQQYIEAWGQGYMSMEFDMWLDDPTSMRTFARYIVELGEAFYK